jgi:hypothetical protein
VPEDAGIAGQVPLRMPGRAVAGVAEHRRRGCRPGERPVVADIGPDPAGDGAALGQHRHRGVVAVQPRGGEHMGVDQCHQRRQAGGAGADPVGDGRDAELDALAGVGLAQPVQRQVLAELGLQDHRQELRAGAAAGDRMEGRRRLGDGLAGAAGELLADGLDDLPLPGHDLQRLGDVLAQLGEPAAAAGAGRRCWDHHALARQVLRQRRAGGLTARGGAAGRPVLGRGILRLGRILAGGGDQLAEFQLELVDQLAAALRRGTEAAVPELGDEQLEMRHHRLGAGRPRLGLLPRQLRGHERGAQRGDVVGRDVRRGRHA